MDQHTPPPWSWHLHDNGFFRIMGPGKRAGTRVQIAQLPERYDGQGAANAQLMASSPGLLEAAQFAHSVLLSQGCYDLSEQMAVEQLAEAIRAAGFEPRQPRSDADVMAQIEAERHQ